MPALLFLYVSGLVVWLASVGLSLETGLRVFWPLVSGAYDASWTAFSRASMVAAMWLSLATLAHIAPLTLVWFWDRSKTFTAALALAGVVALPVITAVEVRLSWSLGDPVSAYLGVDPALAISIARVAMFILVALACAAPRPRWLAQPSPTCCTPQPAPQDSRRQQAPDRERSTALQSSAALSADEVLGLLKDALSAQGPQRFQRGILSRDSTSLTISQGELALCIGTSKATLHRRLHELQQRGAIRIEANERGTRIVLK